MEEIAEQLILLTQQDVKYMVTFILTTLERNWEKKKDAKNRPDNNELAAQIHKHQPTRIWQRYWSFDIKRESTSKAWKRIMRRQIHLFVGYKSTYGTHYRIETLRTWALYSLCLHHCVKYELLLNLPIRTLSVDLSFPVRFLNITVLGDWMKFPCFTHCLHLHGFHKHKRLFIIMV